VLRLLLRSELTSPEVALSAVKSESLKSEQRAKQMSSAKELKRLLVVFRLAFEWICPEVALSAVWTKFQKREPKTKQMWSEKSLRSLSADIP